LPRGRPLQLKLSFCASQSERYTVPQYNIFRNRKKQPIIPRTPISQPHVTRKLKLNKYNRTQQEAQLSLTPMDRAS